jgi:hypothetical protein
MGNFKTLKWEIENWGAKDFQLIFLQLKLQREMRKRYHSNLLVINVKLQTQIETVINVSPNIIQLVYYMIESSIFIFCLHFSFYLAQSISFSLKSFKKFSISF